MCFTHTLTSEKHFWLRKKCQEWTPLPFQCLLSAICSTLMCWVDRKNQVKSTEVIGLPKVSTTLCRIVYVSVHFFLMLMRKATIDFLRLKWHTVNGRLLLGLFVHFFFHYKSVKSSKILNPLKPSTAAWFLKWCLSTCNYGTLFLKTHFKLFQWKVLFNT